MKKILLLTILFIFLFIYLSYKEMFAGFSTTYTETFSYSKFREIKMEMSQEEVRKILGNPFKESSPELNCDLYSKGKFPFTSFTGWISVGVCYDKVQKVFDTPVNVFFN